MKCVGGRGDGRVNGWVDGWVGGWAAMARREGVEMLSLNCELYCPNRQVSVSECVCELMSACVRE